MSSSPFCTLIGQCHLSERQSILHQDLPISYLSSHRTSTLGLPKQPFTTTHPYRCRHPLYCASLRAPTLPQLPSSDHQHAARRCRDGCGPLLLLGGMGVRTRLLRLPGGGVVNMVKRPLRSLLRGMDFHQEEEEETDSLSPRALNRPLNA